MNKQERKEVIEANQVVWCVAGMLCMLLIIGMALSIEVTGTVSVWVGGSFIVCILSLAAAASRNNKRTLLDAKENS